MFSVKQPLFHLIEQFKSTLSKQKNQLTTLPVANQHTPPPCLPGLSDFLRQSNQRIVWSKLNGWFKIWINVCIQTSSIFPQTSNLGLSLKILSKTSTSGVVHSLVLVSFRYPQPWIQSEHWFIKSNEFLSLQVSFCGQKLFSADWHRLNSFCWLPK